MCFFSFMETIFESYAKFDQKGKGKLPPNWFLGNIFQNDLPEKTV